MFKLLFSPFGSIDRESFLKGILSLLGLSVVLLMVLMAIYSFMFENLVDKQYLKNTASKTQTSPTTTAPADNQTKTNTPKISEEKLKSMVVITTVMLGLFYIVGLWCNFCLFSKRLVDLGLSHWLAALPCFAIIMLFFTTNWMVYFLSGFLVLFYILMFLWAPRS